MTNETNTQNTNNEYKNSANEVKCLLAYSEMPKQLTSGNGLLEQLTTNYVNSNFINQLNPNSQKELVYAKR